VSILRKIVIGEIGAPGTVKKWGKIYSPTPHFLEGKEEGCKEGTARSKLPGKKQEVISKEKREISQSDPRAARLGGQEVLTIVQGSGGMNRL